MFRSAQVVSLLLGLFVAPASAYACSLRSDSMLDRLFPRNGVIIGTDLTFTVMMFGDVEEEVSLANVDGDLVAFSRISDVPSNLLLHEIHRYEVTEPLPPGTYELRATLSGEERVETFQVAEAAPPRYELRNVSVDVVFGQMDSCHEGKYRVEIMLSGEHLADIAYYELQIFQDGKLPWLRGARAHTGSSLETTLVEYVPDAIDCVDVTPIAQDGSRGETVRACDSGAGDVAGLEDGSSNDDAAAEHGDAEGASCSTAKGPADFAVPLVLLFAMTGRRSKLGRGRATLTRW